MPGRVELLDERRVRGKRTGWHRHHDPRSKRFDAAPLVDLSKPISGNRWLTLPGPLNQGDLGSCTGNAAVEMASTTALRKAGVSYDEPLATKVYELGTQLDEVPGAYPPDDTGSTTVGVLKALQRMQLVGAYHWAFSFDVALRLLDQRGPLISGFVWHDSFDHPSSSGLLHERKPDRGGHEVCLVAIKPDKRYAGGGWVEGLQSWGLLGPPWIDGWRFRMSWALWRRLLVDEQGEVGIALAACRDTDVSSTAQRDPPAVRPTALAAAVAADHHEPRLRLSELLVVAFPRVEADALRGVRRELEVPGEGPAVAVR